MLAIDGSDLLAIGPAGEERHSFATPTEAQGRAAFITAALSWVGTPFLDCADVKGRNGGVDCAMLLTRAAVDAGITPAFDPRPYSPRHMLHRSEEKFIGWLTELGAHEVEEPRPGDVMVWQFGRTFAHGAILINRCEVVHAYAAAGCVLISRIDEPLLTHFPVHQGLIPRPVRTFSLWA